MLSKPSRATFDSMPWPRVQGPLSLGPEVCRLGAVVVVVVIEGFRSRCIDGVGARWPGGGSRRPEGRNQRGRENEDGATSLRLFEDIKEKSSAGSRQSQGNEKCRLRAPIVRGRPHPVTPVC